MSEKKRIFVVAGESSGDLLGAGLITALRERYGDQLQFEGIAGDKMQAAGCVSVYPMERLSVMGIVAVLRRYRELTRVRKQLIEKLIADPPDCFIGIDAPEFNLDFELALREAGIKTVHYVSPSVWAWRPQRILKIKRAVDHMLCLFTFEVPFYQQHDVAVSCVGHPLADQIAIEPDVNAAKQSLGISAETPVLAVLPGSRGSELKFIAKPFLEAAAICQTQLPDLQIRIPVINQVRKQQLEQIIASMKNSPSVTISVGDARDVMAGADAVLIASGTATLEAMLLKKLMVVGYKMSAFSYGIFSRMLKISNVALPNLLAGEQLVPEFIQKQCQPSLLAEAILQRLTEAHQFHGVIERFTDIHKGLIRDADQIAANAVQNLIESSHEA